jgi:hypothetical protein
MFSFFLPGRLLKTDTPDLSVVLNTKDVEPFSKLIVMVSDLLGEVMG